MYKIIDYSDSLKSCEFSDSTIKDVESAGFTIGSIVYIEEEYACTFGNIKAMISKDALVLQPYSFKV